ncbi:MAG: T9SS type A sorting domain-containing protein [Bacteroidales bacterium]|nr:T9SS type A sorting domain-containing protein [Bacteroidales bacterium]
MKKATLLILTALMGLMGNIMAQNRVNYEPAAIVSFGGDVANGNGSLSISGGQIAVRTSVAPAITVVNVTYSFSEGVQQPFTHRDVERSDDPREGIDPLNVNMAVYPNPTTNHVVISSNQTTEPLTYKLFSTSGQLLLQGLYTEGEEKINLEEYPAGNYMLQVINSDNTKKNIYKIIKAK